LELLVENIDKAMTEELLTLTNENALATKFIAAITITTWSGLIISQQIAKKAAENNDTNALVDCTAE
jgi:Na+/H+ antiporter NhaC